MDEINNSEQTPRPCPHDCRKCSWQQQIFCSAQMAYNSFEQMSKMQEQLNERLVELSKKVEALQSSGTELSMPMSEL